MSRMINLINTKRLCIRRIKTSDWKEIQSIWAEVAKTQYAQYDHPKDVSDEEVEKRIAKWASAADSTEHMFFGVCLCDKLIGYVALNQREKGYEIGYCYHPDYWGKGYAKESISEILTVLKKGGINHVSAGTALNNVPSVKLLLSLGFKQIGTEKVSFYLDDYGNDIIFEGGVFDLL